MGLAVLGAAAQATADGVDWEKARQHWAFRAPGPSATPDVRRSGWIRQPVDRFILARLEDAKLAPAPEADARTLIRRVTYDLTGLPPTPEEVDAFLADHAEGAYERLVDRLLASPRYGERMASLWLPLARYAEDQAHQVGSDTKYFYPNAHHYRRWVIDAFNRDLPYDRFVQYQLAADQVVGAETSDLPALGFLGLGPKYYNRNRIEVQAEEWQDAVDTVTRTFLGLTVACARCHEHKFDPVSMQDYYALAGVFASTKLVNRTPDGEYEPRDADAAKMRRETLHIVEDDKPVDLNVFVRGNVEVKGPVVQRRFLAILSEGEPAPFRNGSGRAELASAIASPQNPLTARVYVNRLWGLLFGAPLVRSQSNFGLTGEPPTHPELLDDLAHRFQAGGWSTKALIREMARSAAYRQSSQASPAALAADPANRLFGRMSRRRLTVEMWRDSLLAASATLDPAGGPSQELSLADNRKRTVYARISRLKLDDFLMQFDYPDANVHAEARSTTTTPMQKLILLNGPFVQDQTRALLRRLESEAPEPGPARVERAYRLLFSRPPSSEERELGLAFTTGGAEPAAARWERYLQVLLMSNELLYRD